MSDWRPQRYADWCDRELVRTGKRAEFVIICPMDVENMVEYIKRFRPHYGSVEIYDKLMEGYWKINSVPLIVHGTEKWRELGNE